MASTQNNLKHRSPFVRALLIIAGSISVALAVLGIVLPVLPTTPFLLLAAWCYVRSSERFYQWLINHRLWGKYLRDYLAGRGVPNRIKAWALTLLWVAILSSAFFAVGQTWAKILLLGIAVAVSIHILMLKTRREE